MKIILVYEGFMGKKEEIEKLLEEDEKIKKSSVNEDFDEDELLLKPKPKIKFTPVTVILILCLLVILGFTIVIISNPVFMEKVSSFFRGELGAMKEAKRASYIAKMREIEALTANKYGTVTLFYYPKNAKVQITQHRYTETVDEYVERVKKGIDKRKLSESKEIDNHSLHLKEKQIIEQLPLHNLPISEKSEDGKIVNTYEYKVVISKEGYESRNFYFLPPASHRKVEGTETLVWEQRGPDVYLIEFRGADLLPKPETAKENFLKAKQEIYCLNQRIKKENRDIPQDYLEGFYQEIRIKYGFKTKMDWNRIEMELKNDTQWWSEMEKELKKVKCE